MFPNNNLQQRWQKLESALADPLGNKPGMEEILLIIGIRESGLPHKKFTENEKINLRQIAVCTILVPAKYYELIWVDDFGWPNFNQLMREPELSIQEREDFLKPFVLMYAEKNKMI